jgi:hypothetical protein
VKRRTMFSVHAENRGEGGCITAPPSIHPSGKVYELLKGDLCAIPKLDLVTAEALFDAPRALAPVQEHPAQPTKAEGGGPAREGDAVIDAYNNQHRIEAVLEAHGSTRDRAGRYGRRQWRSQQGERPRCWHLPPGVLDE